MQTFSGLLPPWINMIKFFNKLRWNINNKKRHPGNTRRIFWWIIYKWLPDARRQKKITTKVETCSSKKQLKWKRHGPLLCRAVKEEVQSITYVPQKTLIKDKICERWYRNSKAFIKRVTKMKESSKQYLHIEYV